MRSHARSCGGAVLAAAIMLHAFDAGAQQRTIVPGRQSDPPVPVERVAPPADAAPGPQALQPAPPPAVPVDPEPATVPTRFAVVAELALDGIATQTYACDLGTRPACTVRVRLGDTAGSGYNGLIRLRQWPHARTFDIILASGAQDGLEIRPGDRDTTVWNGWSRNGLALGEIDDVSWSVRAGNRRGILTFRFEPAPPVVETRMPYRRRAAEEPDMTPTDPPGGAPQPPAVGVLDERGSGHAPTLAPAPAPASDPAPEDPA